MIKPLRIQLSRRKGFKLTSPNGLEIKMVTRPGIFGNPFRVGMQLGHVNEQLVLRAKLAHVNPKTPMDHGMAVAVFKAWIETGMCEQHRARAVRNLRGHNLACWCAIHKCDKCGSELPDGPHVDGSACDAEVSVPDSPSIRCTGTMRRSPCHADVWLELVNKD